MEHIDPFSWDIGHLPFMWNPLRTPHNPDGLPDTLPFTLTMNRSTGALIQAPMPLVSQALSRAYSIGSMITGQMGESGIGRRYTDDFLSFMGETAAGESPFTGQRVLEIGCGNGYLLHRLAGLGANVLGLEPGEHGQAKYNVPVVKDFFPSTQITGPFDVIVMFGVLEHVEQPVNFIEQVFALLARAGKVFIGVPDCAPYIEAGDLSCLIHEHWSYFDHISLAWTLLRAGGDEIQVRPSGFGGLLYACVSRRHSSEASARSEEPEVSSSRLENFRVRAKQSIRGIARFVDVAATVGESVGVYVPGRIINALFAGRIEPRDWRFFDDNPLLKGSFFPGLPMPIEDRSDLLARPTTRLLIMSRSFGDAMVKELRPSLPAETVISTWYDLFDGQST